MYIISTDFLLFGSSVYCSLDIMSFLVQDYPLLKSCCLVFDNLLGFTNVIVTFLFILPSVIFTTLMRLTVDVLIIIIILSMYWSDNFQPVSNSL